MQSFLIKPSKRHSLFFLLLTTTALLYQCALYAQTADGNNGLSQANTIIRSYFDTATQLLYGVGALLGLAGAVRVFTAMLAGEQRSKSELVGWFGSCVFLVIVASVLKSFFGI
jgi:hypothetical protein